MVIIGHSSALSALLVGSSRGKAWVEFPMLAVEVQALDSGIYAVTLCCGFMQRPHVPQALADAITRGQLPLDPREVTYYLERHTFLAGSAGQMDAGARASSPS
jgi:K+ transporter